LNTPGFLGAAPLNRRKRKEGFGEEGKPVLPGCPSSPKTDEGSKGGAAPLKKHFRRHVEASGANSTFRFN